MASQDSKDYLIWQVLIGFAISLALIAYLCVTLYRENGSVKAILRKYAEPQYEAAKPQFNMKEFLYIFYDSGCFSSCLISVASSFISAGSSSFTRYRNHTLYKSDYQSGLLWDAKQGLIGEPISILGVYFLITCQKKFRSRKHGLMLIPICFFFSLILLLIGFHVQSKAIIEVAESCVGASIGGSGILFLYRLKTVSVEYIIPAAILYLLTDWAACTVGYFIFRRIFESLGNSGFIYVACGPLTVVMLQAILM